MTHTQRKLAGTVFLVLFIFVYVLLAMLLAAAILPRANRFGEFMYYALAGLAWVPPAGLIIRWMHRI